MLHISVWGCADILKGVKAIAQLQRIGLAFHPRVGYSYEWRMHNYIVEVST